MTAVRVSNVTKVFSRAGRELRVLDDISMVVDEGEIVCLLGPSGCGKTTLLNIIVGIETVTTGSVSARARAGYVPQQDMLLPWRTTFQNITLPLELRGRPSRSDLEQAKGLAAAHGLGGFLNTYPSNLSGGMRQIVSFVRAATSDPTLFLFDEPFSSLDYAVRLRLEDDVVRMIKGTQRAALFVTHDIEEAISMADRLYVMTPRPGRILKEITVAINAERRPVSETRLNPRFRAQVADVLTLMTS